MSARKNAAAAALAIGIGVSGGQFEPLSAASAAESAAPASSKVRWQSTMQAVVGHVVVLPLPEPVSRVVVGDPKVADYRLTSRTELFVLGKSVGTTNFLLWRQSGPPVSLIVKVSADLDPLEESMKTALPQEQDIELMMASGSIVLRGSVADVGAADTAVQLAQAYTRQLNRYLASSVGGSASGGSSGQSQVINLLRIRDAQQVMLDVRIAEVSKSLLDKLGLRVQAAGGGDIRWNVLSSFLGGGGATAGLLFSNGNAINLEAEKQDGLVRILAEPTIVAMSGQEGSFLVGGKVYIPITQSVGTGGSAVTLQEREFGVGLKFVPTVLDGGRISLKVAPEVSEISKESINSGNQSGSALLPAFTTRRVSTTVQLQDGQSLVIGGLVRNSSSANRNAFPILGEIPILGALFRSNQFVADLTELVVVVRARLVQATETPPSLPTDSVRPPTRREFFLDNQLQGAKPEPAPLAGEPNAKP
ncbi:MAG: pilus assembly protein N-terminal domain-containing protein [Polaromonas sp.]|nr:pilus assembly protein N-terminal domain-containing protein [Polaromonas sp.]